MQKLPMLMDLHLTCCEIVLGLEKNSYEWHRQTYNIFLYYIDNIYSIKQGSFGYKSCWDLPNLDASLLVLLEISLHE
jgi:hypothetical protein